MFPPAFLLSCLSLSVFHFPALEGEPFLRVLLECRSRMWPSLTSFPLLPANSALFFICPLSQVTSLSGIQISLTFLQVQISLVHTPFAQGQSLWAPAMSSLSFLLCSVSPWVASPAFPRQSAVNPLPISSPHAPQGAGCRLGAPTLHWIDSSTARNPSGCATTTWGEQERLCQPSPAWPALGPAWILSMDTTVKAQAAQLPPLEEKSPQRKKERETGIIQYHMSGNKSPDGEWGRVAHWCLLL